jgi:2-polyprenyl-6-methoxyphenol hydroxylase-like FAD-dependent oxidoreductase
MQDVCRDRRGFAAVATHDDQTLVIGGWPFAEYEAQKPELERNYLALFDMVPSFAARIRRARRESRVMGAAVESYFRKPYGPGWALVGDAGYNKDPITAQGISDAFRDAELLVAAVREAASGARRFEDAMHTYWSTRDEHVIPMFELTCKLATLEPPPPDLQHLFAAIAGDQDAMDAFVRVNAGVTSPDEFFAPANVTRMFAAAAARAARVTAPAPTASLPR